MMKTENTEDVVQAIRTGFSAVPRPSPDHMIVDRWDGEGAALRQFINERNFTWEDYAAEPPDSFFCQFAWLTPEGFRYFLPGVLVDAVRNPNPTGYSVGTLVGSLIRPKRQLIDCWEVRARILTDTERTAIVRACHFLRECEREKCSSEWEFTQSTMRRDLDKILAVFDVTVAGLGHAAGSADHEEAEFYSRFGGPVHTYAIGNVAYLEYTCRDGRVTLRCDRLLLERDHLLRALDWERNVG